MRNTRDICKAFFNFNSELNKGHGIIAAIYELMRRERAAEQNYFDCIDKRMEREASNCHTPKCFIKLTEDAWCNVDISKSSKWSSVAYIFYVTDKIDVLARNQLDVTHYGDFKKIMETLLADHFMRKFGNSLSPYAWDMMTLTSNLVPPTNNFSISSILVGVATIFVLKDMFC